jgi:hypothetical protein
VDFAIRRINIPWDLSEVDRKEVSQDGYVFGGNGMFCASVLDSANVSLVSQYDGESGVRTSSLVYCGSCCRYRCDSKPL